MIQLLDLEDSTDSTPSKRKGIKEERRQELEHDDVVKSHDNDSLTSDQSVSSHIFNKAETDERHLQNAELVKASRDPTLSWFAGACHVWQSTEDEIEEKTEDEENLKCKDKRKLWPKLSGNIFGLNIYKNLANHYTKD